MYLDANALNLIALFESNGHAAYAVGGCVRDSIMCRDSNDTDIAVSCIPSVTVSVLENAGIRYIETGLKHGTVTAVVDHIPYEITTFRTDGDYTDNRHPDSVTFVSSVDDDLARRDFTVNAMAYSPSAGIVDLFGGREDIKNKIIRTVGDPDARFGEDALRILRALRFASVLDFEIEPKTAASIIKNRESLLNVARERITAELEKLLCGVRAADILRDFGAVFCTVLGVDSVDTSAFNYLPCDFALRLASICDGGTLVLSKVQKHRVATVRANANADIPSPYRLLVKHGYDDACDILTFLNRPQALASVRDIKASGKPYHISHLAVNGNDLMEHGLRGADIKNALATALLAIADGELVNEKQQVLDFLLKI